MLETEFAPKYRRWRRSHGGDEPVRLGGVGRGVGQLWLAPVLLLNEREETADARDIIRSDSSRHHPHWALVLQLATPSKSSKSDQFRISPAALPEISHYSMKNLAFHSLLPWKMIITNTPGHTFISHFSPPPHPPQGNACVFRVFPLIFLPKWRLRQKCGQEK